MHPRAGTKEQCLARLDGDDCLVVAVVEPHLHAWTMSGLPELPGLPGPLLGLPQWVAGVSYPPPAPVQLCPLSTQPAQPAACLARGLLSRYATTLNGSTHTHAPTRSTTRSLLSSCCAPSKKKFSCGAAGWAARRGWRVVGQGRAGGRSAASACLYSPQLFHKTLGPSCTPTCWYVARYPGCSACASLACAAASGSRSFTSTSTMPPSCSPPAAAAGAAALAFRSGAAAAAAAAPNAAL